MDNHNGWTGKVLRVDLSEKVIMEEATSKYEPEKYIGGRGFGARIAWDEIPPEVGPFDPENRLMFFTGPLVGTMAPGSGRLTVCGVSAQNGAMSDRDGLYSWSGIGGRFGIEMKFAGYDGIIFQGKSPEPVYLWIKDGDVEIREAEDLWGMTCGGVIRTLMKRHGSYTKVAAIGPAGENKSRIGSILTDSGSAAGQGGFGGVMGSKNLKAVAIQGNGGVNIHDNESLLETVNRVSHELCWPVSPSSLKMGKTRSSYSVDSHSKACTMGCQGFCFGTFYMNLPGKALETEITGLDFCFGVPASDGPPIEGAYLCNQLGINIADFSYGIVALLQYARQQGLIEEIDGLEIPKPDYEIINGKYEKFPSKLLATVLRRLAYREGELGDAMAEGGVIMAQRLFGDGASEILSKIYPGAPAHPVGHLGHWDCHWLHGAVGWPHWLVSGLIWATANRDPGNDTLHSFTDNIAFYPGTEMVNGEKLTWDKVKAVSKRLYGMEGSMDYQVTYDPPEAKARPAAYHRWRGALLSSLLLCDWQMPRVFSIREMEGPQTYPQAESEMFSAVTGIKTSEKELDKAGERIVNLERALDVRYGRTRDWDEAIIPYYKWPSLDAEGEGKYMFDADKFKKQLTAFYEYSGWDKVTGWPTRAKLEELGLKDVANELASIGKLP